MENFESQEDIFEQRRKHMREQGDAAQLEAHEMQNNAIAAGLLDGTTHFMRGRDNQA